MLTKHDNYNSETLVTPSTVSTTTYPNNVIVVHTINKHQVSIFNFFRNNSRIGHMFFTHHPTIIYEAYKEPSLKSKRINTIEEAIDFLTNPELS
jgi:hypothetical protein